MRTERMIIYPKDITRITGKSERYGRELLKRIRIHLAKEQHQFVTVNEFCLYTGLQKEDIISLLN